MAMLPGQTEANDQLRLACSLEANEGMVIKRGTNERMPVRPLFCIDHPIAASIHPRGNGNVKPNLASALVTILAQVSKICAPVASIRPQVTPVMMNVARVGFYVPPILPEFPR